MPNHVTTLIHADTVDDVEDLIDRIKTEEYFAVGCTNQPFGWDEESVVVDFNRLILMPRTIFRGNLGENEERLYGRNTWFDWALDNWGTKWNAYNAALSVAADGGVTLRFDTAWSHPMPIVEALSKKNPTASYVIQFADEDLGYNLGEYSITNGVITHTQKLSDGTLTAKTFAAEIKYGLSYSEYLQDCGDYEVLAWAAETDRAQPLEVSLLEMTRPYGLLGDKLSPTQTAILQQLQQKREAKESIEEDLFAAFGVKLIPITA